MYLFIHVLSLATILIYCIFDTRLFDSNILGNTTKIIQDCKTIKMPKSCKQSLSIY